MEEGEKKGCASIAIMAWMGCAAPIYLGAVLLGWDCPAEVVFLTAVGAVVIHAALWFSMFSKGLEAQRSYWRRSIVAMLAIYIVPLVVTGGCVAVAWPVAVAWLSVRQW